MSRLLFLLLVAGLSGAATADKPNIILIMADDVGIEGLGCYGGVSYRTPNLDRMAAEGMRFTQAYSQPLCTPTRVQLMTGKYNHRNWRSFGILDWKERTFGHAMSNAGYATAIIGKWQLQSYDPPDLPGAEQRRGTGMHPKDAGFDEYALFHALHTEDKGSRYANPTMLEGKAGSGGELITYDGGYGEDIWVEKILDFFGGPDERPKFVYYPMALPHWPFQPTPNSEGWDPSQKQPTDLSYARDMIEYMDTVVGNLMNGLNDRKLHDDTIIIFYSDNGTHLDVFSKMKDGRTIQGGKATPQQTGIHVPLIVHWPGHIEPSVCDDIVDASDFLPTLLDLAGASATAPGHREGDAPAEPGHREGDAPAEPRHREGDAPAEPRHREGDAPAEPRGGRAASDQSGSAGASPSPDAQRRDGISFAPQLLGKPGPKRESAFFWYDPRPGWDKERFQRHVFALNKDYKLFRNGLLLRLTDRPLEEIPVDLLNMTPDDQAAKDKLSEFIETTMAGVEEPPLVNAYGEPEHDLLYVPADRDETNRIVQDLLETGQEVVYGDPEIEQHKLWIFNPLDIQEDELRPCVVFIHGGGWGGRPASLAAQSVYLQRRGINAVSIHFRAPAGDLTPADTLRDARRAYRWIVEHGHEYHIDADHLIVSGGSAGGHLSLALCTIALDDDPVIEHLPKGLVLFNPVIDLVDGWAGGRAKCQAKGIAPQEFSPAHHVRAGLPPVLVLSGSEDALITPEQIERFRLRMAEAGNRCDVTIYPGAGHGFFNYGREANKYFQPTMWKLEAFAESVFH